MSTTTRYFRRCNSFQLPLSQTLDGFSLLIYCDALTIDDQESSTQDFPIHLLRLLLRFHVFADSRPSQYLSFNPLFTTSTSRRSSIVAMSLNKRQQARNEKALQDLIKSVPGNDICADCLANHPGKFDDTQAPLILTNTGSE